MLGVSGIFQAVLITAVAFSLIFFAIPFAITSFSNAQDSSEAATIKQQFVRCGEKILETARTGSSNKCIYSINRGIIFGDVDGIHYKLTSSANLCSQSDWIQIDEENHVWQRCNVSRSQRTFETRWAFPSVLTVQMESLSGNFLRINTPDTISAPIIFNTPFNFTTLSLFANFIYTPGESGNDIQISRVSVTTDSVTLALKIT